jgi:hypothetical protein
MKLYITGPAQELNRACELLQKNPNNRFRHEADRLVMTYKPSEEARVNRLKLLLTELSRARLEYTLEDDKE